MLFIQKKGYMNKVQMNKNIFYFELGSQNSFNIQHITVSMLKIHELETIFTSYYVMNIQYAIGMIFGSRYRAYSTGVNDYFGPKITNRPNETPNYAPGISKFDIYSSSTLVLVVPHIRTLVISFHNIWFQEYFKYIHKKEGVILSYINQVKSIHGNLLPTTCGYHNCGKKTGLMLDLCFLNITLNYQYYKKYCIIFCLDILPLVLFDYTGSGYSTV